MANPITIRKLTARIQERVGMIFVDEVNDPRWGFVTVSRVELARDLSQCRIFYSVLGSDADRRNVERALENARGFIQRKVAAILKTRTTPSLEFRFDPSVAGAVRVGKIISDLPPEGEDHGEPGEATGPAANEEARNSEEAPDSGGRSETEDSSGPDERSGA